MTCDSLQNRLLTLTDPRRVPADLRPHLDACPGCAAFLASFAALERDIARLPVPPASPEVKAALLAKVSETGPIITRAPAVPVSRGLADWLARVKWQHAAGLAASVAIAAGAWWAFERPKPPDAEKPVARRHGLLENEVASLVKLATADTPAERLDVWAKVADELRAEAKDVFRATQGVEINVLEDMYAKAVQKGVVVQAERLAGSGRVVAAADLTKVKDVAARLANAETATLGLAASAPPQSKPALERMAKTAKDARQKLEKLARREA